MTPAELLAVRAESLYESIGGDLCVCQRAESMSWCVTCQQRMAYILTVFKRLRSEPVLPLTPDEKLARAKQLTIEATNETRAQRQAETAAHRCQCGHRRKEHALSTSINYTEGWCMAKGCTCRWFLMREEAARA